MEHMTQEEAVLKHMQDYRGITSKEAFEKYGITRLSAVIFRLRKDGHLIGNSTEVTRTRLGGIARYDRYYLVDLEGN